MPVSAIITADIVNSTKLSRTAEKKLVADIGAALKGHRYEFYRGDSFQVYVKDPGQALELLLRLRAIAIGFSNLHDIRSGIGIGQVAGAARELKTSTSEAFVLSGRAFDELAETERLVIASANTLANTGLGILASFIDFIFRRLTSKQAAVVNVL